MSPQHPPLARRLGAGAYASCAPLRMIERAVGAALCRSVSLARRNLGKAATARDAEALCARLISNTEKADNALRRRVARCCCSRCSASSPCLSAGAMCKRASARAGKRLLGPPQLRCGISKRFGMLSSGARYRGAAAAAGVAAWRQNRAWRAGGVPAFIDCCARLAQRENTSKRHGVYHEESAAALTSARLISRRARADRARLRRQNLRAHARKKQSWRAVARRNLWPQHQRNRAAMPRCKTFVPLHGAN